MTGCRVILVMGEAKVIKLGSRGKEQREEQRSLAAADIYHTEAIFTTQFQRLPKQSDLHPPQMLLLYSA